MPAMAPRSQIPARPSQAIAEPDHGPIASPYEQQLDRDSRWALSEASLYFEGKGAVQRALQKITRRLHDLGIPYTVVGGLALFNHGYRRFTEDVDLLVTKENLAIIHEKLEVLGYLPPFAHSKNLRDTELGIKIEFLLTGEFPGDGKPKPVAFPEPASSSVTIDGVHYLTLESLVELKLASGMTNPGRAKDLGDVTELIKALNLPLAFAEKLNPFVQERFREIWRSAQRRFVKLWMIGTSTERVNSLDDLIRLNPANSELGTMKMDGVILEASSEADGHVRLVSTNPQIAERYGMVDESELWPDSTGIS
jgi:hypothetical protein